jgi:hypothetical protein
VALLKRNRGRDEDALRGLLDDAVGCAREEVTKLAITARLATVLPPHNRLVAPANETSQTA